MHKHLLIRLGLVIMAVTLVLGGLQVSSGLTAGSESTGAENNFTQRAGQQPAATQPAAPRHVQSSIVADGQVMTQSFNLHAGWNTIYLEVEPINDSPLVNVGTADEPIWEHEQSTIEAVFDDLGCDACLESVWTWNVPLSRMDYIVDPAEGLWDEPGWKRYFPETSLGPDGASRGFLTDLFSLHANTGYLVKLKDGTGPAKLGVRGQPVVAHHQWLPDSYNLAGFPIDPDASPSPTVATFFQNLVGGPSPVTEVLALQADGTWSDALAANARLAYGEAYLVYYRSDDVLNYTAPLNVIDHIEDGLQLAAGFDGRSTDFRVENLAAVDATITLSLVDGGNSAVALRVTDPVTQALKAGPATITLYAGKARRLEFTVIAAEQPNDGETLLEIASAELGTRWLVPVTARRGDYAGLWVGDVVVNDVSEGRLGGTNVEDGELTIALRPRDLSGIQGSAELVEVPAGNTASVALTLTLALPTLEEPVARETITGTAPYLAGYVYVDTNQNGQPDASEMGFEGVEVQLTPASGPMMTTTTTVDGSYLFAGLTPGAYTLSLDPQPPSGYTVAFDITEPATTEGATPTTAANAWPVEVTVDAQGVTRLVYRDYNGQQIEETDFPRYDAEDRRVEPQLDFGYTAIYDASLWTGQCSDRRKKHRDLGPVVNGVLVTNMHDAALNPGYVVIDPLLDVTPYLLYIEKHGAGGAGGQGVACGEITVGAPTRFANGDGSEFRFRVLLRVNEHGDVGLLPDYVTGEGKRVSSAAFSISEPITATGANFGNTSGLLDFSILIGPDDPLNPYKHKYHPDHDNLDVKFNPIDFNTVSPYLWESYEVRRRMQLELTELPPVAGATTLDAAELDWGGVVWGGRYKEVIEGIHKNDITVKGYFVIRHALAWEDLTPQAYDQAGGGGG